MMHILGWNPVLIQIVFEPFTELPKNLPLWAFIRVTQFCWIYFWKKKEEEKEIDNMYEFWQSEYRLHIYICLPMVVSEVCENVQI